MSSRAEPSRPGQARAWLLASRPATLPAAVTPVLVGTAVGAAEATFRPIPFLVALLAAVLIQIGTNLANDYFDFRKGADTADRLGPIRVTQSGLIAPERVRAATILTFGLAALAGLYLVLVGGWPILLIGLFSIASGVLYTGGPWPLGYHGLGELFVFVFFGLIAVVGSAYLQSGAWSGPALVAAVPVGCIVTAIIVVNNLRDLETDRRAGKRTLAVRLGPRATRVEYLALLILAFAIPPLQPLLGEPVWRLLPLLTLPLALRLARFVWRESGRPLNAALKGTGQLHLLFGLLYAASYLL